MAKQKPDSKPADPAIVGDAGTAGGDQAQAGDPVTATAGTSDVSGNLASTTAPAADPDPLVEAGKAAAEAGGLDPDDLDKEDLAELAAAAAADAARARSKPIGPVLVTEANGVTDPIAVSLLLEACDVFGVDPNANAKPRQLIAWKFYRGDDTPGQIEPDAVTIVTAGGLKVKHYDDPDYPMDTDTLDRLRRVFGCYAVDPTTKLDTVKPLPASLTLPAVTVTGIGTSTDHQYPGSYVKSGGRKAAEDKAKRRADRLKRMG